MSKKRMSGWWIAFLIFDAILLVLVLFFLF
jgi:hypothetical protein